MEQMTENMFSLEGKKCAFCDKMAVAFMGSDVKGNGSAMCYRMVCEDHEAETMEFNHKRQMEYQKKLRKR